MENIISEEVISQEDLDKLLHIDEFINNIGKDSLVSELERAILNSGKLELSEWKVLREHISKIEDLIPHIDLIIRLKSEQK